jgi:hypothetical protein
MASGANEGALRLALLNYVGGIERPVTSPVVEEMDAGPFEPAEPSRLSVVTPQQAAVV